MTNKQAYANKIGTICYLKDRRKYQGKIVIGKDENGKSKRKSVYGQTEAEVAEKLFQIKYSLYNKSYIDKNNITLYDLAKEIVDEKLKLNVIKETTYARITSTIEIIKPIYNIPIQKINPHEINLFSTTLVNYAQSTIDKVFLLLNNTFNEAIKRKLLDENPMINTRKPRSRKADKKIRALTIEEQKKLYFILYNEDIKYSQQMLISMLTGMRMGEVNALEINDINFNKNTIYIHKTIGKGKHGEPILSDTTKTKAGTRVIHMSQEVQSILKDAIMNRRKGFIFYGNNRPVTTSQVYSEFIRTLNKFDIIDYQEYGTVSLHSLRHTYATRCIESGMQPKVLQKILGHTDITVTMNTYCDAFDTYTNENLDKAEEYLQKIGISNSKNK